MSLYQHYQNYRKWASKLGLLRQLLFVIPLLLILRQAMAALPPSGRSFLITMSPWICIVLAPIAAFDAYGGERYRGRPRLAIIRAISVLFLLFGIAILFLKYGDVLRQ